MPVRQGRALPHWVPAFAGTLALLLTSACTPALPPAPVASARPTIVSLNPCSDAILAKVADPGQLLAISAYSRDPRSSSMDQRVAARFRTTAGTVEEVLALRPDVVVSGTFLAPATLDALHRLGVRVELLPIANSVEESEAQVRRLAALAGHPARGEAMVRGIERALEQARPLAGEAPVTAVVWQSGGIVPGGDTLITDLLRRTGFVSQTAQRGMKQADYLPLEDLIADPPQMILAAGDVHGEEDRMLAHPALAGLHGTRRENLDPSLLYCGGPTIIRAAERLAQVRQGLRPRDFSLHPREGGGLMPKTDRDVARGPRLRGDAGERR
jgi:iron complex transport system substrate-binding protein